MDSDKILTVEKLEEANRRHRNTNRIKRLVPQKLNLNDPIDSVDDYDDFVSLQYTVYTDQSSANILSQHSLSFALDYDFLSVNIFPDPAS